MISSILSRLSVFYNGSVWALYLLHVIIRTALFCSLNILSNLKPHDNMQYCRWGRIKLLYKIFNIFWGKNRFNLHIIPSDLDILFDIFCTCPFHVKCWSIVKPNDNDTVVFAWLPQCNASEVTQNDKGKTKQSANDMPNLRIYSILHV